MAQLADSETLERPVSGPLPWRGPGPGRPDLPLPPGRMPLRRAGNLRKRWRYIGLYGPEVMLCVARASVGPFRQSFWSIWDRDAQQLHGRTRLLPGNREVAFDGDVALVRTRGARIDLKIHPGPEPVEAICPSGPDGYGWTRKVAGLRVTGSASVGGRSWDLAGCRAVEDVSAGFHRREVHWHWSAGIGESVDGRAIGWNLVTGINDPPAASERAIWIEDTATEPAPVRFEGLAAITFADGKQLSFQSEAERARNENMVFVASRYRHRFGSFSGSLPGVELAQAFGVMEEHEARW